MSSLASSRFLAQVTCNPVNDAEVVSDTLPSSLACGATYEATVTMLNTGTTTWTRDGSFGYKLGQNGDGDDFHNGRIRLPEGTSIAPGQTHTFTIGMEALDVPGDYVADWRMFLHVQGPDDEWFGEVALQVVNVHCN